MARDPYAPFLGQGLSLTDHLAIDRTVLANERTALAYGRTVLAMLVVGGTCVKFFDSGLMHAAGVAFITGAAVVAVIGWLRFNRTRRYLAAALERDAVKPQGDGHARSEEPGMDRPGQ
jgi:putative membrane protein